MRRALGTVGLLMLVVGLAAGTAGGGTTEAGQDGYGGVQVLGEQEALPDDAILFALVFDETGKFEGKVPPGAYVDVEAEGFGPESKGTIELVRDSERTTLAFITADEDGVVQQRVQIPDDYPEGDAILRVVGLDADGNERIVTMELSIGFEDGGGSNWEAWTAGSIALALALLGAGWWFFFGRQRQRETEAV